MLIDTKDLDERLFDKLCDLTARIPLKEKHDDRAELFSMLQGYFPITYHGLSILLTTAKAHNEERSVNTLTGAVALVMALQKVVEGIELEPKEEGKI